MTHFKHKVETPVMWNESQHCLNLKLQQRGPLTNTAAIKGQSNLRFEFFIPHTPPAADAQATNFQKSKQIKVR